MKEVNILCVAIKICTQNKDLCKKNCTKCKTEFLSSHQKYKLSWIKFVYLHLVSASKTYKLHIGWLTTVLVPKSHKYAKCHSFIVQNNTYIQMS